MKNLYLSVFHVLLIWMTLHNQPCQSAILEINALYLSDTAKLASDLSSNKTNYDIGLGFNFSRKGFLFELVYGSATGVDKIGATTNTLTISDQGIKVGYLFGRQRQWGTSLTYNFITRATLNDGTTEVQLRGTSIKFDFGYLIWMTEHLSMGIRLNYYAPTFTEQVVTTSLTNVSYNRVIIYPGLNITYDN